MTSTPGRWIRVAHEVIHRAECPVTIIPEQVASRIEATGAQPIAAP